MSSGELEDLKEYLDNEEEKDNQSEKAAKVAYTKLRYIFGDYEDSSDEDYGNIDRTIQELVIALPTEQIRYLITGLCVTNEKLCVDLKFQYDKIYPGLSRIIGLTFPWRVVFHVIAILTAHLLAREQKNKD